MIPCQRLAAELKAQEDSRRNTLVLKTTMEFLSIIIRSTSAAQSGLLREDLLSYQRHGRLSQARQQTKTKPRQKPRGACISMATLIGYLCPVCKGKSFFFLFVKRQDRLNFHVIRGNSVSYLSITAPCNLLFVLRFQIGSLHHGLGCVSRLNILKILLYLIIFNYTTHV